MVPIKSDGDWASAGVMIAQQQNAAHGLILA
jgi:hypothetical protein